MKAFKYILATTAVAISLGGCSNDDAALLGEGQVMIRPQIIAETHRVSRTSQEELESSLQVWISNSKGVIRQYKGMENIPTGALALSSGMYLAEAWAGDSVSASWDKQWYKGAMPFEVKAAQTTSVGIVCQIANTVVSVQYSDDVKAALSDYTLTVGHSRGQLTFDDEHASDKAYFMMPSKDKDLAWTLTGIKNSDGETLLTRSGSLTNVKPGYEYVFKVTLTDNSTNPDPIGGGFLNIEIEEIQLTHDITVTVPVGSVVTLATAEDPAYDLTDDIIGTPGSLGEQVFTISACSKITSLQVSCEQLKTIFETASTFDAVQLSTQNKSALNAAGIKIDNIYDETLDAEGNPRDVHNVIITFGDNFINDNFDQEGIYTISFEVRDTNGFVTNATASYSTKNDAIVFNKLATQEISYNTATLSGKTPHIDKYTGNLSIDVYYQDATALSRAQYEKVAATIDNGTFSAEIEGLVPTHTYNYYAVVYDDTEVEPYTTPIAQFQAADYQLPNNGFENWQTSSSPYLIYGSGEDMFWDSGNHGSSTMKKNVTIPDTNIKHSGEYSIKLASQFVGFGSIGKFAAGNVFIGKYLATDGTDGILGFGRPFDQRPVAITGYVRYVPGTVEYTNSGAPDIISGQPDKGIIYAALLDNTVEDDTYGETFPVVIKTKTSQLFDKNGSNVIAYAEIVFEEATAGSGMVQFTITFDYRNDKTPSYILLCASASKGGDYFSGGSSNMWLDDITLVY